MKKDEMAKKMICTPKKEMVSEHKRLVKTLRAKHLTKEASKQAKELKEYEKS